MACLRSPTHRLAGACFAAKAGRHASNILLTFFLRNPSTREVALPPARPDGQARLPQSGGKPSALHNNHGPKKRQIPVRLAPSGGGC